MIGHRGTAAAAVLCALVLCAFAAQSALAAKGTTAFTCAKTEKETAFSDAHCTKAGTGAGYKHQAIATGEKTNIVLTNQKTASETTAPTPAIIKIHFGPMEGELECQGVKGEGTLTNNETGGKMNVSGTVSTTFSECTVSPTVTFPECQLEKPFTSTTTFSTPREGMNLSFVPEGSEVLVKFRLIKCKASLENTEYAVSGSYTGTPNGTTWETTTESSSGLKSSGGQAGLISKTTVTRKETETGISMTTTES